MDRLEKFVLLVTIVSGKSVYNFFFSKRVHLTRTHFFISSHVNKQTSRKLCLLWNMLKIQLHFFTVLPYNTFCARNDNDNDLEDEMELRLERDGQRMTLRLKKSDHVTDDVPVYAAKDNVVREVDTSDMPVSSFYHVSPKVKKLLS